MNLKSTKQLSIVRKARTEDIPEIVSVLKASLGEKDLPLSEVIWNFKHHDNPFGKSLVLIAEEEDKIIGVRAFMRWQWNRGSETMKCFRAVDTATHPEHQGKGIFKTLTLKAIDMAMEENANFIFNTPNDNSRPGYLKMGWESKGKIEVALQPAYVSFWKFNKSKFEYNIIYETTQDKISNLCEEWNLNRKAENVFYTPKSLDFLTWRYEENPLQKYEVFACKEYYISGYVKRRNRINELRIAECVFKESKDVSFKIQHTVNAWALKFGAQVVSFSPKSLNLSLPFFKGKYGPVLTLKELDWKNPQDFKSIQIKEWKYTIGDLELF